MVAFSNRMGYNAYQAQSPAAGGNQLALKEALMKGKTNDNRMVHYDLLRILAAFSVVILHISAQFWYDFDVTDFRWLTANTYDALFRFGVPVFVMISGALFLPGPEKTDMKRLYCHNIMRLLAIFIVWSCLYGLLDCYNFGFQNLTMSNILQEMLFGRYHLWYLPLQIGIYMLLPILRIWIQNADKKNIRYFLLLFLIFQVGSETLDALFVHKSVTYAASLIKPYMVCGYLGYFIWGYYIAHYGIQQKYHKFIYAAGVLSLACNVFFSNRISLWKGQPLGKIYDSFGIFTFMISTALFLFSTARVSRHSFGPGAKKVIRELSLDTLGVYALHIGLIEILTARGIHSMLLPNIVGIPLFSIFCFITCTLAAAILRRIPVIGKYIC